MSEINTPPAEEMPSIDHPVDGLALRAATRVTPDLSLVLDAGEVFG